MADQAYEPCGCATREGHVEPHVDPVLHIEHGERDPQDEDQPPPYFVPGTGGWNGLYTAWPDAYCLCGHPEYSTCWAWLNGGGMAGLTVHDVGGFLLTTLPEGDSRG